jgi:Zn-dependent alcohol dehydrogenase
LIKQQPDVRRIGQYVVDQPMIIGQEAAGVIVATGEGVNHRCDARTG